MHLNEREPFSRAEALAAGITVDALAGPRYQRLFHGLYVSAQVKVTVAERARAALKISPAGSYASHHTAAALWGGWVPDTSDTHVSVIRGARSKRRGIQAHRAPPAARSMERTGIALSPPVQTMHELAAVRLDLVDLVVFGDSMVTRRRTTPDALIEASSSWSGAGAGLGRRAARLVRAGVDSAPETRLRMLIVLAGLPEPQVNHIVRELDGSWSRRFDLCYPELRLIIEYDGRHHVADLEQWSNDILRRELLESQGWRVIIINADALFNRPVETLERVRRGLTDCGAVVPRRLSPVWPRHFPDHSRAA